MDSDQVDVNMKPALPFVCDSVLGMCVAGGSVVVVISSLISLMEDHCSKRKYQTLNHATAMRSFAPSPL